MRLLLIDSHPDSGALSSALADAYLRGARQAGHEIRLLRLRELRFDPILHGGQANPAPLEPDLARARNDILWCEHFVIATPVWWWSFPALLKGFIDRIFAPGFSTQYFDHFPYIKGLLRGRSAEVLYTQNAKQWMAVLGRMDVFWFHFKYALLRPCGFFPVRRHVFAGVKLSTPKQRQKWLEVAYRAGRTIPGEKTRIGRNIASGALSGILGGAILGVITGSLLAVSCWLGFMADPKDNSSNPLWKGASMA